jgi:hypothetical protein
MELKQVDRQPKICLDKINESTLYIFLIFTVQIASNSDIKISDNFYPSQNQILLARSRGGLVQEKLLSSWEVYKKTE